MNNVSTEINSIIDNLCNKLGVGISTLIPEMSKCMIARRATALIILLILGIVCAIFTIKSINYFLNTSILDLSFPHMMLIIIDIVVFSLFSILLIDLIGWIASPTASFYHWVVQELTSMRR